MNKPQLESCKVYFQTFTHNHLGFRQKMASVVDSSIDSDDYDGVNAQLYCGFWTSSSLVIPLCLQLQRALVGREGEHHKASTSADHN